MVVSDIGYLGMCVAKRRRFGMGYIVHSGMELRKLFG